MVVKDGRFIKSLPLPRPLWRYEKELRGAGIVSEFGREIKEGVKVEDMEKVLDEKGKAILKELLKVWEGKVQGRREVEVTPKTLEQLWEEKYPDRVKRVRAKRVMIDVSSAPAPVPDDENFYNLMTEIDWDKTLKDLFGKEVRYHRSLWVVMHWDIYDDEYEKMPEAYQKGVHLVIDTVEGDSVWVLP